MPPLLNTLAKLEPPSSPLAFPTLSTLAWAFWRELGLSEPIAPQLPVDVRELGGEHSTSSPFKLPDPLRPDTDSSSSVSGVGSCSSAVSEMGLMLPELPLPDA